MFRRSDKRHIVEQDYTKQVRYSILTLYLNNSQTIQCSNKIDDGMEVMAPYKSFHDWMMGPASSNAFFISTLNGGSYIKRDCLSAYTITEKVVEEIV